MIPDLGTYAVPVLSAYGVSLSLLAMLVAYVVLRARAVKRALEEIENG